MKILAITQSGKISGGANRSFLDVLRRLRDNYGHEIDVLVPEKGQFTDSLEKMNINYIIYEYYQTQFVTMGDVFDIYRHLKAIIKCKYNYKAARELKETLSEKDFDIVYINDTTNTVGYYLARLLGKPYLWHFRGYQKVIKKYMPCEKELREKTDGILINISKAMYNYMKDERKISEDKMEVVYNGVENSSEKKLKNDSIKLKTGFHCVQCGHISEAKGQIDSIKALGILNRRGYQDIYLHLAGTPSFEHGKSYKEVLDKVIEENGLLNKVIFEGEVQDMPLLRSKMDIELVCSVCEPFGRVTVEGMQSGLPVIGSNTGGTPEIIINGENGFLYNQGNPEDLAEAILKLYNDENLKIQMSKNAVEYTKTHFTMEENVKQINQLLIKATEQYKGQR